MFPTQFANRSWQRRLGLRSRLLITAALFVLATAPARAGAQTPSPPPAPAKISISGVPAIAATNQLLTFSADVSVNPGGSLTSDVSWDFGDGSTATGATVTHAYRSTGAYDAHVSVVGSIGSTASLVMSNDAVVTVQDSVTLQPGDSITFASPYVPFRPPPGSPPPPAFFTPLNVEIDDESDQPVSLSYGAIAANLGDVDLALPDGYALQVIVPPLPHPTSSPGFEGCRPAGDQPNAAACTLSLSGMPGGTQRLMVEAADVNSVQTVSLAPRASAVLLGPAAAAGVPALFVSSGSDQNTAVTWDGEALTIAVPDGYAVSVYSSAAVQVPGAAAGPIECSPLDDQSGAVECFVSAIPPVQVSFSTVQQVPSGTLTLPYADDQGPGTMTIANIGPDAAPGGAIIDVTLTQGSDTLSGSGVMRPQGTYYLLAFELTDTAANRFLYQVSVMPDAGGFSGKGLWLTEADKTLTGQWSLGTPPAGTKPFDGTSIISVPLGSPLCAPGESPPRCIPPAPGLPLPIYTGNDLLGTVPPSVSLQSVSPPSVGRPGQPVNLIATGVAPCCGQGTSQTYQWSFGDGTMSPPSGQQTVTHTWTSPGVYTVTVVFTDETGVSTFSLTQVQLTPAGS